jgi:hypothetical protein
MNMPTPDEAVNRAQRVLNARLDTIRRAVEARQSLADVHDEARQERLTLEAQIAARIRDAENTDARAYMAALQAGWSAAELKKIGLSEPEKKRRTRRRVSRSTTPPEATTISTPTPTSEA